MFFRNSRISGQSGHVHVGILVLLCWYEIHVIMTTFLQTGYNSLFKVVTLEPNINDYCSQNCLYSNHISMTIVMWPLCRGHQPTDNDNSKMNFIPT